MSINYLYKTANIPVPQGFKCDICKKYFEFEHYTASGIDEFSSLPNFLHVKHSFGYGSTEDGSIVDITLCDTCVSTLCHQHKIKIVEQAEIPRCVKDVEPKNPVSRNNLDNFEATHLSDGENLYGFSPKKAKDHPDNGKVGYWEVMGVRHKAIIVTDNAISAIDLASEIVYEWELCEVTFIGEKLPKVYQVI